MSTRFTVSFPSLDAWRAAPESPAPARCPMNGRRWIELCYDEPWWRGEPLLIRCSADAPAGVDAGARQLFLPLRIEHVPESGGLPVVRFCGHGFIDAMDGWYADEHPPARDAVLSVLAALRERMAPCIVDLAGLMPDSPLLAALRELGEIHARDDPGLRHEPPLLRSAPAYSSCADCLVADTSGGLATWGQSFHATLAKKLRRIERWHYRQILPGDQAARQASARALLAYHRGRWQGESDAASLAAIGAIVTRAIGDPLAHFPTLVTADHHLASVLLVFQGQTGACSRARAMNSFYMQAFDPALHRVSPSRCNIALYLRHLAATGCAGLDFLRGDEDYKREFCTRTYSLHRVTLGLGAVAGDVIHAVHDSFI